MSIRNNAELLCAAQYGYIELVKIILKKDDLDVNFQGAPSCSSLIVATKNNYVNIVKLLLKTHTCFCYTLFFSLILIKYCFLVIYFVLFLTDFNVICLIFST